MAVKTFYLNKQEGRFMGVCSGIADYTGVDATWIRIGAVVATLLGAFPWTLLAYGVTAWLAQPRPSGAYNVYDPRSAGRARASAYDLRMNMRDIDRRMAEVETYVTTDNSSLAREIEQLRDTRPAPAK
jgi:phage shock protein C